MSRDRNDNRPRRALGDDVLDLVVRGVFAYTLIVIDAAEIRRAEFLRRQAPELN